MSEATMDKTKNKHLTTFGQRLRDLRIARNLSQDAIIHEMKVSTGLNISQAYWSTLEKRVTAPREDLLVPLAEYFNVSVGYFLGAAQAISFNKDMEVEIARLRAVLESITCASRLRDAAELAEKALDGRIIAFEHNDDYILLDIEKSPLGKIGGNGVK